MEADERGTHDRLMHLRFSVMEPIIARHRGRVIKNTGDGFLAMFDSALAALEAAQEMQRAVIADEAGAVADRRIAFRMGVNVADVIVEDHDIYGDGVNVAARLQSHAEPGGIVISGLVAEHVGGTLGMRSVDLGQMHMRNRAHPVRVLSLRLPEAAAAAVGEVEAGHEARPSIAVLPFRKLATADDGYFADGIVDNIIHALAALKELFVIARGSSFKFRGQEVDLAEAGEILGAGYLLTGTIMQQARQCVVAVELCRAPDNKVIWAGRFTTPVDEIMHMRSTLAGEIVGALEPRIQLSEALQAAKVPTEHLGAWAAYHRGLWHMYRFNQRDNYLAAQLFAQSVKVDPGFARAYAGLSFTHFQNAFLGFSPDIASETRQARVHAMTCMELDPLDPFVNLTMGRAEWLSGDLEAGLPWMERSIALSPNYAFAIYNSALVGTSSVCSSSQMTIRTSTR